MDIRKQEREQIKKAIKAALPHSKMQSVQNKDGMWRMALRNNTRDGERWIINVYTNKNDYDVISNSLNPLNIKIPVYISEEY